METEINSIMTNSDDLVIGFTLEDTPIKGQIVRLGPATADDIIAKHNLNPVAAKLLGELLVVCVIMGAGLKMEGKLIVEIRAEHERTDLAFDFIVAEYTHNGTLRGTIKHNKDKLEEILKSNPEPSLKDLFGEGFMLNTLDLVSSVERYQGNVAFEDSQTISELAEHYFAKSEQIPTRILAATETAFDTSHPEWRAYGIMIQKIANDDLRGDTDEDWNEAVLKFNTLKEEELLETQTPIASLLYNLYHEEGVRVFEPKLLIAKCNCSKDRLVSLMKQYINEDYDDLLDENGKINAICEFCNTSYSIAPTEIR